MLFKDINVLRKQCNIMIDIYPSENISGQKIVHTFIVGPLRAFYRCRDAQRFVWSLSYLLFWIEIIYLYTNICWTACTMRMVLYKFKALTYSCSKQVGNWRYKVFFFQLTISVRNVSSRCKVVKRENRFLKLNIPAKWFLYLHTSQHVNYILFFFLCIFADSFLSTRLLFLFLFFIVIYRDEFVSISYFVHLIST